MFTDDRQALWWSVVAGSFFWHWRETGSPCDGPWWLGASSGTGERQAVPVMVPGGWYCTGGLWEPWLHWYCAGGAVGSPGFAGTVLGAVGSPSFAGTVLGLWRALASLVLCWGAVGSPGFAGTVLGAVWSPGFAGTVLGGCGEPWLCWYCTGGLWGALASLVLYWGAVGSPGFAGTVLGAVGSPGFTGTVLGGCGEPWLCWYFAGGLLGALASLRNLEISF